MKNIAVLVENKYQVLEVWYPYLRLKEEGIHTILAGTGNKSYTSKEGYPAFQDGSVIDIKEKDLDGVIIPGGYAPDILRRFPEVNSLVKDMFNQGKLVAAICHGGWVLASAGVLKDKKATCFYAIMDDIINAGATYLDQEVVVDKNLITSRKPSDLPFFCKAIIEFLKK